MDKPTYIQFGTAKAMHEEIVSLKVRLKQAEAEVERLKKKVQELKNDNVDFSPCSGASFE